MCIFLSLYESGRYFKRFYSCKYQAILENIYHIINQSLFTVLKLLNKFNVHFNNCC